MCFIRDMGKKLPHFIFLIAVLCIFAIGYFYFFQLSPTFVEKPYLEKPLFFEEKEEITPEHLIFLLNEIDAFKLHEIPFTGEKPVIEVVIENEKRFFTVDNHQVIDSTQNSADIKIVTAKKTIISIFNLENSQDAIISALKEGNINIELLEDEKTLALKGYKVIYDILSLNTNEITGQAIYKLNPVRISRSINLSVLIFFSLILGLILEKEI